MVSSVQGANQLVLVPVTGSLPLDWLRQPCVAAKMNVKANETTRDDLKQVFMRTPNLPTLRLPPHTE